MSRTKLLGVLFLAWPFGPQIQGRAQPEAFWVRPYLQSPSCQTMDLLWVTRGPQESRVCLWDGQVLRSQRRLGRAEPAWSLDYSPWEKQSFGPRHPGYLRQIHWSGLQPNHRYRYQVEQEGQVWEGDFNTAPSDQDPVRLIAYADSETEPESAASTVSWPDPLRPDSRRNYLVDQQVGYAANLQVIAQRKPDLVLIAGDLVESGGEQRDWDEFWRLTGPLAAGVPLVVVPGNHEYFGGPEDGGYQGLASRWALGKFRSYFPGLTAHPGGSGLRACLDYGPITIVGIDSCNGQPQGSPQDSNWHLHGSGDFNPGSPQYRWLVAQLQRAQRRARFTLVMFHHCPYSSGVHGSNDPQSGHPLRILTPLFLRYGVDIVVSGHDEMLERSSLAGQELRPGGGTRPHQVQFYDVGVAGDGLRGPDQANPWSRFLAHRDSPEHWVEGQLVDGGKHYGHLEIDIAPQQGRWTAVLTPVYLLPKLDIEGQPTFERRQYPDVLELTE